MSLLMLIEGAVYHSVNRWLTRNRKIPETNQDKQKKKDVVFIHAGVLAQSEEYEICLDWQIR